MTCPACGAGSGRPFHAQRAAPVNSCLLLPSRTEAVDYPRGDIELAWCQACGFVWNTAFRPALSEYSARYEETQAFSETFNSFARDLAKRWVERYDLNGRTVLEIGCGKGEFLVEMIEAGAGRGIGIDPGTHPARITSPAADRIEWIVGLYGPQHAVIDADAVVCRHTLEHNPPVGEFLGTIRLAIGDRPDVAVLFEVPDVRRVLDEAAFWDVYYEHCSYFSAGSLARLFRSRGFDVVDVRLEYDDQYLIIEARPASGHGVPGAVPAIEDDVALMRVSVDRFAVAYRERVDGWRDRVARVAGAGGRVVIWGAGSKGVAFLDALGPCGIDLAVDINPHKHGMYMAGGGQRIVPPEQLRVDRPGLVIAMNPVYLGEIRRELVRLGIDTDLVAV